MRSITKTLLLGSAVSIAAQSLHAQTSYAFLREGDTPIQQEAARAEGVSVKETIASSQAAAATGVSGGAIAGIGLLLLAAGAGLAGGGGSDAPSPLTDPLPQPGPDLRDFETAEYFRNWGLDSINAQLRYRDGGRGQGTLAGVLDSGVDITHTDLAGQVVFSRDYFNGGTVSRDVSGHGTHVATTIAGLKNDIGTHGVAFDGKLAIFRALDGGPGESANFVAAWRDTLRQSANLGAIALNNSWNFVNGDGTTVTIDQVNSRQDLISALGSDTFAALDYARDRDLISVYAAGNSGKANVGINGGLAVYFPEYADHTLAVVAIDQNDQIAFFSERCGQAASFCLAAPGVDILAGEPGSNFGLRTGTSMAAPHVTGAIMVLKSNFPELTSAQITQILRDTARDLGAPGVDEIYGHGALDLANAVAPQGQLSFQTSEVLGERSFAVEDSYLLAQGGMLSALQSSLQAQDIMITDRYDRGYMTEMSNFVSTGIEARRSLAQLQGFTAGRRSTLAAGDGTNRLALAWNSTGALGAEGFMDPALISPYANALSGGNSMAVSTRMDGITLGLASLLQGDGQSYVKASAGVDLGGAEITLGAGHLTETSGFLGTSVSGAFGSEMASETRFTSLSATIPLHAQAGLILSASAGETDFVGNGLLMTGDGIGTRSYGIGFAARSTWRQGDSFTISASQALNIDGGSMMLAVPTAVGASEAGVRSSDVTIDRVALDLGQNKAPVDLRIGYERDMGPGRISYGLALQEGGTSHQAASVGYRIRF